MKKNNRKENSLVRLAAMTKPIVHWLILGAVLDILAVISAVIAPELMGQLVQTLYDFWEAGIGGNVRQTLISRLIALAVTYAAMSAFSYLNMLLMSNVVTRFFTSEIRIRISEKITRLPVSYVDQTPVGDILSRMISDVSILGNYVHDIFNILVKGGFQILLIAFAMFRMDWRLACFVVVLTPASIWLSIKIAAVSEKYFDSMLELDGKLTELAEESYTNHPTTKAYNLEHRLNERFDALNKELAAASQKADFASSVVQPIIRLCNSLAYILINLIGGYLAVRQGVSVGTVVTIVLFARQFAGPLEQLSSGFGQMNRVKAAASRVFTILDKEEEPTASREPKDAVRGEVEFSHVYFSYDPKQPLIEDLNFTVRPGQSVAIVGPTGAGKTTIVNLLMRFYDIGGTIRLDGEDISALTRESVRERFGMVLQDTWLFKGTIAENVAYGKPGATREEVEAVCRQAYCHRFIRTMPMGYDTVISEDTTNLSGGQKQLLTIARALLADRPLLILDEATSNVDTRTEILIQKAMDKLMENKTSFVIAHRLSTIVDSDLILVLNHGRIVEQGTHKELLEKRGFYHTLYTSQYAVS